MKVLLNDSVAKNNSKRRGKNKKPPNPKGQPQVLVDQIQTHKSHKKPHWVTTGEKEETNQTPR